MRIETKELETVFGALCVHNLATANWLVGRLLPRKDAVRYAVFSAEQVLHIYEKEYPNDKRPRNAIEMARRCITDLSLAAQAAARDAAWAAYADAWAAYAAAEAAYTAAGAAYAAWAAYAAAGAAYAAAGAAYASYAAWAAWAAYAAARKKLQTKIINYGLGLLEESK